MEGGRRTGPVRSPPVVLLDTNALFLPFRERFPLEAELARVVPGSEVRVPAPVRREVARLVVAGHPGAPLAAEFAGRFPSVPGAGEGDVAILGIARRLRAAVVTADAGFRDRLLAAGIPVLSPRGLHRLVWATGRATGASPRRPSLGNR
jgi:rRNA-processing protein FCF1